MDIISGIIYVVLFIIIMVFVFSIGMLRPFMPKKELAVVFVAAFIIGAIGGTFFIYPLYEELPNVTSTIEKVVPSNNEDVYLDVSSSIDLNELQKNLTSTEGVVDYQVTGFTVYMWAFDDTEYQYFNRSIGNLDSHYDSYHVNQSGKIDVNISKDYSISSALKSISDWYNQVYGDRINYAQVHIKLTVKSSEYDDIKNTLAQKDIIPTKVEGPVQDTINSTNSSMISYGEFAVCSGIFGIFVSIMGVYYDTIAVQFKKLKKFFNTKIRRKK